MAPKYNWEEHEKGNKEIYMDDESAENVSFQQTLTYHQQGQRQDSPSQDPPTWLKKLRNLQPAASNWATNGPSKWADKQSAITTQMSPEFYRCNSK